MHIYLNLFRYGEMLGRVEHALNYQHPKERQTEILSQSPAKVTLRPSLNKYRNNVQEKICQEQGGMAL